jgi:hypothetical protein
MHKLTGDMTKSNARRLVSPVGRKIKKRYSIEKLWSKAGGKCEICRNPVPLEEATRDHILPTALGGKWSWDNLRLTCQPCNIARTIHLGDIAHVSVTLDIICNHRNKVVKHPGKYAAVILRCYAAPVEISETLLRRQLRNTMWAVTRKDKDPCRFISQ